MATRLPIWRTSLSAVSAVTGDGIEGLREIIADLIDDSPEVEIRVPAGDGEALAWLYQNGRITARSDQGDGAVRLLVMAPNAASERNTWLAAGFGVYFVVSTLK